MNIPNYLPALPKGCVYLGIGGTFKVGARFEGWRWRLDIPLWIRDTLLDGSTVTAHYCAPADSEVVRLNAAKARGACNTYKELTPKEVLKRLAEAGHPLYLHVKQDLGSWVPAQVRAVDTSCDVRPFFASLFHGPAQWYARCAEVAKDSAKPWTQETAPKGHTLIRLRKGRPELVICGYDQNSVRIGHGSIPYQSLLDRGWQHSIDCGKTWNPCTL